ncbi:Alpha/Beta hydrolase protein [Coniochaeta sp. 2T2.1]|nr:Alpha/Beta hydrolase protein [Coniochaeta sp. 2T2.1]
MFTRHNRPYLFLLAASLAVLIGAKQEGSDLYLGGGLTILTQNLLDGAANDGNGAILVSQPSPYYAAETACKLLGETLWNPDIQDFTVGLNTSLSYQVFQGLATKDQLYWIAKEKETDTTCAGITPAGEVCDVDCSSQIPALCTQAAPVSTSSVSNTSAPWQIEHFVDQVQLTGYRDYHTFKFRGLRYAETPERFTYSKLKLYNESAKVSALNAGADCVQPIGEVRSGSSEDCLFLNVWTPYLAPMAGAEKSRLKPVMVYLYGGGFTSGSGKNPNTDGTNLASRGDAVVISVNYRVGSAGFLAFNDGVHNGNYGISDMVTALEWVKKYAQYFGGDADRVTVFGESAGAMGVHILLGSPKAKGLFRRAIMQSDPSGYPNNGKFTWSQYATPEDEYRSTTAKVLKAAGCLNATDQIACVNKLSGFDLVNLTTNANGATADGTNLLHHELDLSRPGYAADIDVMTGINRDEAGVLVDNYPTNGTNFNEYFANNVGNHISLPSSAAASFQLSAFGTDKNSVPTPEQIFNASLRIATDGEFTCFELAKAYAGAKNRVFKSTYAFEFNRTYSPSGYTKTWCDAPKTGARPHGDPDGEYYKCHAGEQLIVFGNVRRAGQADRDGLDVPFTQLVVDHWSAFARTGDPNPERAYLEARGYLASLAQVESTGRWEPVDPQKPTIRLLQWNGAQVPFVEQSQCQALALPLDMLASSFK